MKFGNVTCFSEWVIQEILAKIAPTWMNISLKMKEDPETDKTFGWVLEMYEALLENCYFFFLPLTFAGFLSYDLSLQMFGTGMHMLLLLHYMG